MWDRQTEPFEIAKTVLKPETARYIRENGYANSAYKVLDRWALNSPDELRRLEAQGPMALETRLNAQLMAEIEALNSYSAWRAGRQGMNEYEFLLDIGVDTELRETGQ
jgi:hypothetical protein